MQEGDLVLCTVDKIEKTTVFVKLENGQTGNLVISEIAPGRIRNLREYVVPNKKLVCKILRISGDNIDVSLRRVSSKEKSEILEKFNQEQSIKSAFRQILKEEAKDIEEKVTKEMPLLEFVDKAKQDESLLNRFIPEKYHESIKKIMQKRKKEVEVKKIVKLKCLADNGIQRIKKIMSTNEDNIKIVYLAAGNFQITVKALNYKDANHKIDDLVNKIESDSKSNICEFSVSEK